MGPDDQRAGYPPIELPAILRVPQPIRCKKKVTRTVYWNACPLCREEINGWRQDVRDVPARRTYTPCGCVATEEMAEMEEALDGF